MRGNTKGFTQIILIIVLLIMVGGAAYYYGSQSLRIPSQATSTLTAIPNNINCNTDEEYFVDHRNGQGGCVKKPSDAGKSCTKSSACQSGYCVTKEIKATKGICYDSYYNIPCSDCYWTIESSQKAEVRKQISGGGESTFSPCCTY